MSSGKIVLITIVGLTVLSVIITAISVRTNPTDDFDWWFGEVKRLAPSFGFKPEDVDDFDRVEWYDWYALGYEPECAIKNSLSIT